MMLVGELNAQDENKTPIVAVLEPSPISKKGKSQQWMIIISSQKRHNLQGVLNSSELLYEDKKRSPDHVSRDREGKISSEYWYTNEGVIRGSTHWGEGIATCDWYLNGVAEGNMIHTNKLYGKAKWGDFIHKTDKVTVDGKEMLTSFENVVGKSIFKLDGKEYIYNSLNGEFITEDSFNDDTKYSLPDKKYAEAVESGDMQTAQEMVDEAARESGYDRLVYHQTSDEIKSIMKSM